jgi:hypothetical protein
MIDEKSNLKYSQQERREANANARLGFFNSKKGHY